MGGDACVIGSWPSAGAAAPRVKPPANVAPLFRSSRRFKRFEPIGLSFAYEPERKPEVESIRPSRGPIEQVRSALGPPLSRFAALCGVVTYVPPVGTASSLGCEPWMNSGVRLEAERIRDDLILHAVVPSVRPHS